MWWMPLAAAAVPTLVDVGRSLFSASARRDRGAEQMNDAHRRTLTDLLYKEATGDPMENQAIQAALGQLSQMMQVQKHQDDQTAARYGLEGSEFEIAQSARRGNTFTDAYLGIVGQAGRQRNISLSQALDAQRMNDHYLLAKRQQQYDRAASMGGTLGNAAYSAAQLYGEK